MILEMIGMIFEISVWRMSNEMLINALKMPVWLHSVRLVNLELLMVDVKKDNTM